MNDYKSKVTWGFMKDIELFYSRHVCNDWKGCTPCVVHKISNGAVDSFKDYLKTE